MAGGDEREQREIADLLRRVEALEKELRFTKDRLGQTIVTTVLAARSVLALAQRQRDQRDLKHAYGNEPTPFQQLETQMEDLIDAVLRGADAV